MKNISIHHSAPSRKGKLIRNLVMLLAALMWLPAFSQENTPVTYSFMLLKDGTTISGKVISKTETEITIMDFTLGTLTIKTGQVVKENDLLNGNSYCVKMSSGKEYCGTIVSQNDSLIYINTVSIGEIALDPKKIAGITSAEDRTVVNGEVWFKNPHGTRYLYMPTAIPLKKGDGYFQNSMLLLNTVNYGVTDHVSVGAGFLVPVGYMLTAKTGYKVAPKVYLGAGAVYMGALMRSSFGLGAGYGEITFGDENKNCSFSAGYGVQKIWRYDYSTQQSHSTWAPAKAPMFNASGMIRVGNRFALLTENWFYPEQNNYDQYAATTYHAINSIGFRTMWEKSSFDLAAVRIPAWGDNIVLPYIDYVFKF